MGKYTGLRNTVIFGGVKQLAQTQSLNQGVEILVATPGRLLQLVRGNHIDLKNLKHFIIDECDKVLQATGTISLLLTPTRHALRRPKDLQRDTLRQTGNDVFSDHA